MGEAVGSEVGKLLAPVDELDWTLGPPGARTTLVEYADFEDPACRRVHFVLHQLRLNMGDQLRFIFRHCPQSHVHSHALRAAEAAEAAGAQGRFWEMHDLLFTRKDALELWDPVALAEELRIDPSRFVANLESRVFLDRVRVQIAGARRSGVLELPAFFIDGNRYEGGADLPSLSRALGAVEPEVEWVLQP
jgi:protein-disulfide isomerase